ncbi:MAG: ParA family protein [Chloroflexi bacterium]|nr:ParA family protein [Chloroflexota bacterium]
MTTRIIALANQKGGVGKTTSSINLACGWARYMGADKVLLIDADPQANASAVLLGIEFAAGPRQPGQPTIREVLKEEVKASEALYEVPLEASGKYKASRLHILPAHLELALFEVELSVAFRGEYRLKKVLTEIERNYDLIIVDCPPSLGILTLNALIFAHEVIIPVDPGLFPLIGLNLLRKTIEQVKEANPALQIRGVIPTMQMNTVVSRETLDELHKNFGQLVLPGIPRRVAIEESHVNGVDVFQSAPDSDSAMAYDAIIQELMKRV